MSQPIKVKPVEFGPIYVNVEGKNFRFTQLVQAVAARPVAFQNKEDRPLKLEVLKHSSWLTGKFGDSNLFVLPSLGDTVSLKVALQDVPSDDYTPGIITGFILIQVGDEQQEIPVTFEPFTGTQAVAASPLPVSASTSPLVASPSAGTTASGTPTVVLSPATSTPTSVLTIPLGPLSGGAPASGQPTVIPPPTASAPPTILLSPVNPPIPSTVPAPTLPTIILKIQSMPWTIIALVLVTLIWGLGRWPLAPLKKDGSLQIERSIVQNPIALDEKSLKIANDKLHFKITERLQKDALYEGITGILAAADTIHSKYSLAKHSPQEDLTEEHIKSFVAQLRYKVGPESAQWNHWTPEEEPKTYTEAFFKNDKAALHDARVFAIRGFLAARCAETSKDAKYQTEKYEQATAYWEFASHGETEKERAGLDGKTAPEHKALEPLLNDWLAAAYLVHNPPYYKKAESEIQHCADFLTSKDPSSTLNPQFASCMACLAYLRGDFTLLRKFLQKSDPKTLADLGMPNLYTLTMSRFDFDTPNVIVHFENEHIHGKYHEMRVTEEDSVRARDIGDKPFGMVLAATDQQSGRADQSWPFNTKILIPNSESGDEPTTWLDHELNNGIFVVGNISIPTSRKAELVHQTYNPTYIGLIDDSRLYKQGELILRWQTSGPNIVSMDLVLPDDLYPIEYATPDSSIPGVLVRRAQNKSEIKFAVTPSLLIPSPNSTTPEYWAQVKLYCETSNTLLSRLTFLMIGDLLFTIATLSVLAAIKHEKSSDNWSMRSILVNVVLPAMIACLAGEFFWKSGLRSSTPLFPDASAYLLLSAFTLLLLYILIPKHVELEPTAGHWRRALTGALCLLLLLVHAFVASHLIHYCILGQSAFGPLAASILVMLVVVMVSIWTMSQCTHAERFGLFSILTVATLVWLFGKTFGGAPELPPVPFIGTSTGLYYFIGVALSYFLVAWIIPFPCLKKFFDGAKHYLQSYKSVVYLKDHAKDPILWISLFALSLAAMQTYTQVVVSVTK